MSNDRNRRKFISDMLKGSASFQIAPPLYYFIESIFNSAQAATLSSSVKPRRLISIQQPQAPARWVFDMFLTPYMTTQELAQFDPQNQMIRTRYKQQNSRNVELAYETVKLHGINVPYMWKFDIPTSDGQNRPMADLLLNMLSIQGINTTNAGHSISRMLHYLPASANQSVSAMASDYSQAALGSVAVNVANFSFKSLANKSAVAATMFGGNQLQTLLTPFIITNGKNFLDPGTEAAASTYQKVSRIIDAYGKTRNAGVLSSIGNKSSAHEIMMDGFGDLAAIWTDRLAVYQSLVSRAMDQSITYAGFNDYPIGIADTAARDSKYYMNRVANIIRHDNVSDLFTDATFSAKLAERFVLAEYLILNDLSSAVNVGVGGLTGLKVTANKNSDSAFDFDEHFAGMMISPICNFWYNRALASCLLELTTQLKGKTLSNGKTYFDETVIELHGDFHRSPRADGGGSDHGSQGKSVMYLSGGINGPYVMGVLGRWPTTVTYAPGVWGQGAVDPILGRAISNADVGATLANILRVPPPYRTTNPMVLLDANGNITPLASKTKIVA